MNMTYDEIELLALLSRINKTQREKARIRELVKAQKNWESFYNLCELNRYAPFVYKELCGLELDSFLDAETRRRYLENIEKITRTNQLRIDEAKNFLSLFVKRDIDVIILKGIYYAETFYQDPYYKQMNDVDILIQKKDLDAIFTVYNELDYFSAGELLGKSAREHDTFSHHLPPFFSKNLNLMIGTHWELHTPLRRYRLDYSKIWSRAVEFNFYGLKVKSLAPIDHLHHLCVHLSLFKAGARELADITNLIRAKAEEIDWQDFLDDVAAAGSYEPVFSALSMANLLDGSSELRFAIDRLRAFVGKKVLTSVAQKTVSLRVVLLTRSSHISKIDKAFSSFKSTNNIKEKTYYFIEMYKHMFLPPIQEACKILNIVQPKRIQWPYIRLIAPLRIMQSLKDDLGSKIFFLLIAYTWLKMAKTIALNPFTSNKDDNRQYAQKIGVSFEQIQKLKERLE